MYKYKTVSGISGFTYLLNPAIYAIVSNLWMLFWLLDWHTDIVSLQKELCLNMP